MIPHDWQWRQAILSLEPQQRLQFSHRQPRLRQLLSRRQGHRGLRNRGRVGGVASFEPGQKGGVVGVGGVGWDGRSIRNAINGFSFGKLVGHCLKLRCSSKKTCRVVVCKIARPTACCQRCCSNGNPSKNHVRCTANIGNGCCGRNSTALLDSCIAL